MASAASRPPLTRSPAGPGLLLHPRDDALSVPFLRGPGQTGEAGPQRREPVLLRAQLGVERRAHGRDGAVLGADRGRHVRGALGATRRCWVRLRHEGRSSGRGSQGRRRGPQRDQGTPPPPARRPHPGVFDAAAGRARVYGARRGPLRCPARRGRRHRSRRERHDARHRPSHRARAPSPEPIGEPATREAVRPTAALRPGCGVLQMGASSPKHLDPHAGSEPAGLLTRGSNQ